MRGETNATSSCLFTVDTVALSDFDDLDGVESLVAIANETASCRWEGLLDDIETTGRPSVAVLVSRTNPYPRRRTMKKWQHRNHEWSPSVGRVVVVVLVMFCRSIDVKKQQPTDQALSKL
mmetsp:Transcript_6436/g.18136  ORF Transcript_6436/g.18136 Transcript_6436/m.18136 type:complete len:120 (+) Transcript_6436:3511-3870(+)